MRSKKRVVIITAFVFILSFLFMSIIYLHRKELPHSDILTDIFLAIIGSSLLGFIITLAEYFTERRKAMEVFYAEAYKATRKIKCANAYITEEPIDLIRNCFSERGQNAFMSCIGDSEKNTEKNKFINYLFKQFPETDIQQYDFEKLYESKLEEYISRLESCMSAYIEIGSLGLEALDDSYGNLDFIFGNGRRRKRAYTGIYDKIRNTRNSAFEKIPHFKGYLHTGNSYNLPVMLDYVLELEKIFFRITRDECEPEFIINVYQKVGYELECNIEKFRCEIYGQKYEAPSRPVVLYQFLGRNSCSEDVIE